MIGMFFSFSDGLSFREAASSGSFGEAVQLDFWIWSFHNTKYQDPSLVAVDFDLDLDQTKTISIVLSRPKAAKKTSS